MRYLDGDDFKYLGKPLNTQLDENLCREKIRASLLSLLDMLTKAALTATAKIWLYHHFVPSKLSWSFCVNDLSLTFVRELQAMATKRLKAWIGLTRSANPAILFVGDSSRPGLRVRNLVTLWKQQQNVKINILESSTDPRCQALAANICERQKQWSRKFAPAVSAACARTVVEANEGTQTRNTIRKKVNKYIKDIDVGEQLRHLQELRVQGRWLEWSKQMFLDLSWTSLIYNWSDAELRFAVQATTNTAPTPTNLRRWGNQEVDPCCCLCHRMATLRHLLCACPIALQQGRYTWRHDSVLCVLQHRLKAFWSAESTQRTVQAIMASKGQKLIHFVPAGQPLPPKKPRIRPPLSSQAILLQADDWDFLFDIDGKLKFPVEVAVTSQRPDVVIYSRKTKTIIMLELTVPIEDRVHIAHDLKTSKYAELATTCEGNGFRVHLFPIEVGCLGFCPHSILDALEALGLPKSTARQIRTECSRVALRCSYVIFLRRNAPDWGEKTLY